MTLSGQLHDPRAVYECAPSEAFQVAAETRAFLTQSGVDVTGEQETKTKKAPEHFSKRLQAEPATR